MTDKSTSTAASNSGEPSVARGQDHAQLPVVVVQNVPRNRVSAMENLLREMVLLDQARGNDDNDEDDEEGPGGESPDDEDEDDDGTNDEFDFFLAKDDAIEDIEEILNAISRQTDLPWVPRFRQILQSTVQQLRTLPTRSD